MFIFCHKRLVIQSTKISIPLILLVTHDPEVQHWHNTGNLLPSKYLQDLHVIAHVWDFEKVAVALNMEGEKMINQYQCILSN